LTTGTYVDSGGVGGKVHRLTSESTGSTTGSPLLLSTVQRAGASTTKVCSALRSGWSKQAQQRRASSGSNDIHTYTSPSVRSTQRCTPVRRSVERCTAVTTSVLSVARSSSAIRPSPNASGPSSRPLSVADSTSATQSANVVAPGAAQENRVVDAVRSTGPSSRPVTSTAMS
jgi:hypothetical protein